MGIFGKPNIEKMKKKKDVKGLIKTLGYKQDSSVHKDAAEALRDVWDARAVEPLIQALKDEGEGVRKEEKEALDKIKK